MTKDRIAVAILIVVAVVLHGSVMPYLAVFGGRINLLITAVAGIALYYGTWAGIMAGLATGLLADIVLGQVLGLSAVPLVLIGYFTGLLERRVFKDLFLIPVFVGLSSSLLFEVIMLLLSRLAFGTWWRQAFVVSAIPTILINGAFMPVLFAFLGKILRSNEEV